MVPGVHGRVGDLTRCLPPKSRKCQPPARTPQQAVRRTLNRNGLGWAYELAAHIIERESGWNPSAYVIDTNGHPARGLWQLNDQWWAWLWRDLTWSDPVDNTLGAIAAYRRAGGFSPWSCAIDRATKRWWCWR